MILLGVSALGAGLSYYLYSEYRVINNWQFNVVGLRLIGYNTDTMSVQVSLKIINVSNVEAVIQKLDCNVSVQGQYIGTISQSDPMAIPANGYNILTILVTIANQAFFDTLLNLTSGATPSVTLNIAGTVLVSSGFVGLTVPVNDTETYTLADIIS